jgi:predicted nucleic acid-binding OB-fold protein
MLSNSFFFDQSALQQNVFNNKIMDTNDIHCDILAQCIQDIERNSKKYHLHFLLDVLNFGTAIDIVNNIKGIEMNLANIIVLERKNSPFLSARDLKKVGLTNEMINFLVTINT